MRCSWPPVRLLTCLNIRLIGNIHLADLMRNVKGYSGFHVKQHLQGRRFSPLATIWQEGYHDHALRAEEDTQAVARYIIHSPVRAGLVKTVRNYPLWDAIWLK